MKVRDRVLLLLENNKGCFISGESMAEELEVSRSAVWKAIKQLIEEGYEINAINNKGYCLNANSNIMSKQSIQSYLQNDKYDIEVYDTITSTNSVLKIEAENGACEGRIIVAKEQTNGRGRLGRTFFSPSDTGIYMSILLRPKMNASDALLITCCAAVAVAQSIELQTNKKIGIKWVNDLYSENKKVCGILSEASLDMENGGVSYVILGIGVNLFAPKNDFPDDIKNKAGYIFTSDEERDDCRSRLVADIIRIFMGYYTHLQEKTYLDEYRNRSILKGKFIEYIDKDENRTGKVIDIDDKFELIVEDSGRICHINSGEVTISHIFY